MTGRQKLAFFTGSLAIIALGSTVIVLSLERLFPNSPSLTLLGPLLCIVAVVALMKSKLGRL